MNIIDIVRHGLKNSGLALSFKKQLVDALERIKSAVRAGYEPEIIKDRNGRTLFKYLLPGDEESGRFDFTVITDTPIEDINGDISRVVDIQVEGSDRYNKVVKGILRGIKDEERARRKRERKEKNEPKKNRSKTERKKKVHAKEVKETKRINITPNQARSIRIWSQIVAGSAETSSKALEDALTELDKQAKGIMKTIEMHENTYTNTIREIKSNNEMRKSLSKYLREHHSRKINLNKLENNPNLALRISGSFSGKTYPKGLKEKMDKIREAARKIDDMKKMHRQLSENMKTIKALVDAHKYLSSLPKRSRYRIVKKAIIRKIR